MKRVGSSANKLTPPGSQDRAVAGAAGAARSRARRAGLLAGLLLLVLAVAVWANRARILRWRYEQLTTTQLFDRAREASPDPVLLAVAGERLLDAGRAADVRTILDPVVDGSRSDVRLDVLAARAAWLTGEPQRTGAILDDALKVDPGSLDARFWSAELIYSRGNRDLAERLLQEIVAVDAGRGDVWTRLGEISLQAQRYETALQRLDRAEQSRPTGRVAQLRAQTLLTLGRVPEAEAAARQAVRRQPDGESFGRLGEVLLQAGDAAFSEARASLRKAVALDPHRTENWKQLAGTYRSRGDDRNAVRILRSMLRTNPYLPEGYLTLSQCYRSLNRPELAAAAMRTFRRLEPLQAEVDRSRHDLILAHGALESQLREGRALLALGQRDAALQVAARANAKAAGDPRVQALIRDCARPIALRLDPLPADPDGDAPVDIALR